MSSTGFFLLTIISVMLRNVHGVKYSLVPYIVFHEKGDFEYMGFVKTRADCALHAYRMNKIVYAIHEGQTCSVINEIIGIRKDNEKKNGDAYLLDLREYSPCNKSSNMDLTSLLSAKCGQKAVMCKQLEDLLKLYKKIG
ncbi:hypothetical protein QR680_008036 [Steinernema hermaphroditum]|uniref:Uncharacterized protein n=1 Tax=Steinernema hermaphroditum TaxID=289476 RepID=A0AA39M6Y0_9BILA|nr:hypothetical protein QR680_008036 [Steinernema hermaphroditum]